VDRRRDRAFGYHRLVAVNGFHPAFIGPLKERAMIPSLIKTLIFTILVPGTVCLYIPYRLRRPGPHTIAPLGFVGLVPVASGFAVYLWCAWDFATAGLGTPLPLDAPKLLVARGLYRFVRNPMYVGVLLMVLGQALLFSSMATLWYALVAALCFHGMVVLYEEPVLLRKFGESYEQYRNSVPRWIPRW
jgi:protein-S-isoprenylcysteine O-methyltransferase Ste14